MQAEAPLSGNSLNRGFMGQNTPRFLIRIRLHLPHLKPLEGRSRRVAIELSEKTLVAIDDLKQHLGLRTRAELVERLLQEVLFGPTEEQK